MCIFITWVVKYLRNVSRTAAFLCNHAIVTIDIIFTQPQSARFLVAARSWYFLTKTLLSCCAQPWITVLSPFMSSLKCAPSVWALLRVGVLNIIGRMWLLRHAGSKCISMGRCNGWIGYLLKWALHTIPFHQCLNHGRRTECCTSTLKISCQYQMNNFDFALTFWPWLGLNLLIAMSYSSTLSLIWESAFPH